MRVDARIHASSGSCSPCDLSNKRLNGMTLKNANFAGSTFNNSNISGGKVDGSDLTGATFRNALLYRLQGEDVKMGGAILEDATLVEANLSKSSMSSINLHRADLTRAHFTDNDLRSANMVNVKAANGNFSGSNFDGARLDHANFEGAQLTKSTLRGVKFGDAIMLRSRLDGADLSGADLSTTQGLKQEQLDTACGDMNTSLPDGLSVSYCEGTLSAEAEHDYTQMDPEMAKAAKRLERALKDVEIILEATPRTNRPLRRKLERIRSDITNSKRAIEN